MFFEIVGNNEYIIKIPGFKFKKMNKFQIFNLVKKIIKRYHFITYGNYIYILNIYINDVYGVIIKIEKTTTVSDYFDIKLCIHIDCIFYMK